MNSIEEKLQSEAQRNTLKIQALLEKISSLTADYENNVADLRVSLTILTDKNEQLQARVEELEAQGVPQEDSGSSE